MTAANDCLWAALLACLVLTSRAAAGGTNLLANPLFSSAWPYPVNANGGNISGAMVSGWGDNTDWAGPDIRIRYAPLSGAAACGGGQPHCLRARIGGPLMQFGQFGLRLRPGSAHRLTIWLKARPPVGSTARATVASLLLRQAGEPYTVYGQESTVAGAAWRQLSVDYAVVPPQRAAVPAGQLIDCFFGLSVGGPATVWLANASLVQLAAEAPRPAVLLGPPAALPVPRDYFCLHASGIFGRTWFWEEEARQPFALAYPWPVLDFGTFRTWDTGVMWATIQPERRGVFNFTLLDYLVTSAQLRGQKVIFTLGQTPRWASSRPSEDSAYGLGLAAPPRDIQDWRAFVTAVARRYKGRIQAYETWNEPDVQGTEGGFFSGTPPDIVRLEEAAAEVLSSEDPAALLLTPPCAQLQWMAGYLAAGGGRRAHGVALHTYPAAPETAASLVPMLRQLLAAYGLQRLPLWNTEGGLDVLNTGTGAVAAAGFVARSLIVQWALALRTSCWYSYASQSQFEGLTVVLPSGERHPTRLGPGGKAYRQVMAWMLGARLVSLGSHPDGIWVAELRRDADAPRRSWLVWSPAGPAQLAVPAVWAAASWQDAITGKVTGLSGSGGKVTVGQVPLMLAV